VKPLLGLLVLLAAFRADAQGSKSDYERSAALATRTQDTVFRSGVKPHWLPGATEFWYRIATGPGTAEFVRVDALTGRRGPLFDASRLAETLGKSLGTNLAPDALPLEEIIVEPGDSGPLLRFRAGRRRWRCLLSDLVVSEDPRPAATLAPLPGSAAPGRSRAAGEETLLTFVNETPDDVELFWLDDQGFRRSYGRIRPGAERSQHTFAGHVWMGTDRTGNTVGVFEADTEAGRAVFGSKAEAEPAAKGQEPGKNSPPGQSPDGRWIAFVTNSNLHVRARAGGETRVLSHDGTPGDAYDGEVHWSPDSTRLVATRVRAVPPHTVSWIEAAPPGQVQPALRSHSYFKPGDPLPRPALRLFDLATGAQTDIDPATYENPFTEDGAVPIRWAPDGHEFYVDYNRRGHQLYRILAVDRSGRVRTVVEETPSTFVDWTAKTWSHWLDASGGLLWMSERDGWCHLWLIDIATGQVKNQVTRGNWVVRSVERVDAERRQVWFFAGGIRPEQDPYHLHLCRVNFDGSGLTVLTDGDGTHKVEFSPDRRWFLDTWSRVDQPPVTELRLAEDGHLVCRLETADASPLVATGWSLPERFVAKGRDGTTDIHGILIRPSNFDPARKYPVVEEIYAGPHGAFVPKEFGRLVRQHAIAELGFIVVQIDGMGTSQRSKAFQDISWKNLADAGFPDRRLWIQAAARTRPWMDLSHVGIYGGSAGGQSAMRALLDHGDFYKVAVADCGCHDNRMDKIWWNEQWLGWPVDDSYRRCSNVEDAHKLAGKLLLIVGEVDTNVDPASTLQVSAALIRANKDFELLVMPSTNHGAAETPYGSRRRMDFLVRHLHGREPRWE
jgi:dipeptidyl-peptidase 4